MNIKYRFKCVEERSNQPIEFPKCYSSSCVTPYILENVFSGDTQYECVEAMLDYQDDFELLNLGKLLITINEV